MPKNIISLSDGTGNGAANVLQTTVWRICEDADLTYPDQVARYDDGVGSASFWPLAVLGGALAWGLKRRALELYKSLCRHHRHGSYVDDNDRIFGFGLRGIIPGTQAATITHLRGTFE